MARKNKPKPKCTVTILEVSPVEVMGKQYFVYETFRRLMVKKHQLETDVIRLLFSRAVTLGVIQEQGTAGLNTPRYRVVKNATLPVQQRIFEEKEG
mgnify:CR=1 FL=1